MKKHLFCAAGLCLLLGSTVAIAQGKTDFSGNWKLDKSQSDAPPMMGRGAMRGGGLRGAGRRGGMGPGFNGDMTLNIQQTSDTLVVTRQMGSSNQERTFTEKFALDGSQSTNTGPMGRGQVTSTASWNGSMLTIQRTEKMSSPNGDMEMHSQDEYSLSADDQTLTIKTTRSTPRGEMSAKQVFIRQQ